MHETIRPLERASSHLNLPAGKQLFIPGNAGEVPGLEYDERQSCGWRWSNDIWACLTDQMCARLSLLKETSVAWSGNSLVQSRRNVDERLRRPTNSAKGGRRAHDEACLLSLQSDQIRRLDGRNLGLRRGEKFERFAFVGPPTGDCACGFEISAFSRRGSASLVVFGGCLRVQDSVHARNWFVSNHDSEAVVMRARQWLTLGP
eukprot:89285-Chlamydomonas_euryale.AAC.8